ncbi:UDP-N-acetylglucosamine 1-carboxyvinyltransferase [Ktedonosporobacter rubrisoli]|uniref:UDP-N-acetylglucosamine 1-carboxyvinyltransferase n=1 Tax=Ktedonosporobacter rubrisoli TaxID=2509675 RepID=A0A4P6JUQ5_KTERU|nr:UDP-N-acetylglucosamine 1-carboxyvinyltransferase [Ktedonosporobacter rubrisoli]QBD79095.1 UDP-N-acetylglucosamine 1-carboxyvinyltransferase [Ktedonosporobacter rubrisoli]
MNHEETLMRHAPYYLVTGGMPLRGEVSVSGAKNAVTKMVIASLLTTEQCMLRNVPLLGDLDLTIKLCRELGSQVDLQDHTLTIRTQDCEKRVVSRDVGGLNRICVLAIGPMLHRCGEVTIPAPGGDRIGPRPIDYHLDGLRQMGATIEEREGYFVCSASKRLKGTTIKLPFPSVMATENFLITASLAKGVTVIENAANEPEIIDLIKLLQKMGAIIELQVDRRIVVEGVESLRGASHTLLSDRNEAVSLAVATYLTRGDVYLRLAQQDTLLTFLNTLSKMGLCFEIDDEGIRFIGDDRPPPAIALETDVHPGFMTDWQQPFTILLTQANGMSVVHETIYEDRFGYTSALIGMGAHIGLYPKCLGEVPCRFKGKQYMHSCVVRGPTPLKGTRLYIPDIRAGCSYILAALCAEGTSQVYGIEHIERGYEQLDVKLRGLGARIERVEGEPA